MNDPVAPITTVQVASLFIGVFIPIVVSLVTKQVTSARTKAILLVALSAASGFLTELVNDSNFVWQQALLTAVMTFVTGTAAYFGLWRPTGVADKAQLALVK